jgi:hypothetical protein
MQVDATAVSEAGLPRASASNQKDSVRRRWALLPAEMRRSRFLLSSGYDRSRYDLVAYCMGVIPHKTQLPCWTPAACLLRSSGKVGGEVGPAERMDAKDFEYGAVPGIP